MTGAEAIRARGASRADFVWPLQKQFKDLLTDGGARSDKPLGRGKLSGQIGVTLATNVFLAALGMVTGVLVARLLGVQGRGEFAAIQSWPLFISTFGMLGVQEGAVFLGARDRAHDGSIATSAAALTVLAGSGFFAAGWLAMPLLLKAQSGVVVQAARWYLLIIFANALSGLPIFLLRSRQAILTWNLLRLPLPLAWATVLVSCYCAAIRRPEIVAGIFLAVSLAIAAALAVFGLRIAGASSKPSSQYWPGLLRFGLPLFLSTLPQYLTLRVDQLLMAAVLPAQVLGVYVVAVTWAGGTEILSSAIGAVLFPALAGLNHPGEQKVLVLRALRFGVAVSLLGGAAMAVLARPLLPLLFGKPFARAVTIAWVLLLAGAFSSYNALSEQALKGLGCTKVVLWAELVGLSVTLVALAVLLKPFQAMGAALASLAAYGTVSVFLTVRCARAMGLGTSEYLLELSRVRFVGSPVVRP